MSTLLLKHYEAVIGAYSNDPFENEWLAHEGIIRQMHAGKFTRSQILGVLAREHAFQPSRGQLTAHMDAWGLKIPKSVAAVPSLSTIWTDSGADLIGLQALSPDGPDTESWRPIMALEDPDSPKTLGFLDVADDNPLHITEQNEDVSGTLNMAESTSTQSRPSRRLNDIRRLPHAGSTPPLVVQEQSPRRSHYQQAYPGETIYITPAKSRRNVSSGMRDFQKLGRRTRTDSNVSSNSDRTDRLYTSISACARSPLSFVTAPDIPDEHKSENKSTYTRSDYSITHLKQLPDKSYGDSSGEAKGPIAARSHAVIEISMSTGKPRSSKFFGDTLGSYTQEPTHRNRPMDGCRWGYGCTNSSNSYESRVEQLKGYHHRIYRRPADANRNGWRGMDCKADG